MGANYLRNLVIFGKRQGANRNYFLRQIPALKMDVFAPLATRQFSTFVRTGSCE